MTNSRRGISNAVKRVSQSMSIDELAGHIQCFDAETPITAGLRRRIYPSSKATTPGLTKKSWLGWLADYPKTDPHRRKDSDRDAAFVYNHLHFVIMLIWLAESAGVPRDLLERASAAIPEVAPDPTQAARLRKVIPWKHVAAALAASQGAPVEVGTNDPRTTIP
jgi:hypothetical protein